MLRAGICDLGTCDLEMGGVACPAGRDAGRPVHPTQERLPPARRDGIRLGRAVGLPPGARSAGGRLVALSAGRAADLQRYRPAGDDMPHLRPAVWRVSPGRCRAFRPGWPRRFRSGRRAFPPRRRGVSAPGGPRCFRAGCPGVSARAAPARCASRERLPRRARELPPARATSRAPASSGCAMHFPTGRTRRNGSSRLARPAISH